MPRRTSFIPFCHIAVADEIALTANLNAFELGCLQKIRNYLWINNFVGLKDDDKQIARVCMITKKKWLKIRPSLEHFFDIIDGDIIEITWRNYFNDAVKKSENARRASLIGKDNQKKKLTNQIQQMVNKLKPELVPEPNTIDDWGEGGDY